MERLSEILEKFREDICDNYCKYRDTANEESLCEVLQEGRKCPLDLLT